MKKLVIGDKENDVPMAGKIGMFGNAEKSLAETFSRRDNCISAVSAQTSCGGVSPVHTTKFGGGSNVAN